MLALKDLQLIITASPHSVEETIRRLEKILKSKENNVFAFVDHSGEAKKVNMDLSDEKVLIFGDPKIGTYLMQENPLIGMELPLRILVLQNKEKATQIVYIDPISLGESYKIEKNAEILKKISLGLSNIVAEVIKEKV